MISPDRRALFVEVCKTGSTAAARHLASNGWVQNGAKGHKRIPGTALGRHARLEKDSVTYVRNTGMRTYGVVRNPWDRMASLWRASAPGTMSFWEYMNSGRFKHGGYDVLRMTQATWLYGVEHVIRYEQLTEQWNLYPDLPAGELPKVNVSKNRAKPDWEQREVDIIAERFAEDIRRWGYEGPT